jgi:hypothetical protein
LSSSHAGSDVAFSSGTCITTITHTITIMLSTFTHNIINNNTSNNNNNDINKSPTR